MTNTEDGVDQKAMIDKIGDNIGAASAGIGLLLVEVVSAIAAQPGFDRERFIGLLERAPELSVDADPACRAVYEQMKEQLVETLKATRET